MYETYSKKLNRSESPNPPRKKFFFRYDHAPQKFVLQSQKIIKKGSNFKKSTIDMLSLLGVYWNYLSKEMQISNGVNLIEKD